MGTFPTDWHTYIIAGALGTFYALTAAVTAYFMWTWPEEE